MVWHKGKSTVANLVQAKKAAPPILVAFGKLISVMEAQPAKARSPTEVTLGKLTLLSSVQPSKRP